MPKVKRVAKKDAMKLKLTNGSYFGPIYTPVKFQEKVKAIHLELLKLKKKLGFSHIAVCGKSGLAYAFGLQMITDHFSFITVEKEGVSHHGGPDVQGRYDEEVDSYIILDDCIDTGATVEYIRKKIEKHADKRGAVQPLFYGVALHADGGSAGSKYVKKARAGEELTCYSLGTGW